MTLNASTSLATARRVLGARLDEFLDSYPLDVDPDDTDLRLDAFCDRYNLDLDYALQSLRRLMQESDPDEE